MPEINLQAGFRPAAFAAAIGLSRSKLYELPAELQPRSVRLGSARIIVETPRDYLDRVARAQLDEAAK